MTAPQILAVSNATTELSPEENELLLSAINLSSQEKSVQAELKDVKVKVTELFTKRFDVAKTGTIAKLGKSSIQVKRKAGKIVLTDELLELANNIDGARTDLIAANEGEVQKLQKQIELFQQKIAALQTNEEIEFMEFDFKQRVAALPEPEATYEVAIKV
jgi:tRNA U34 5-carboxymethylaminomethyl modifying GTPase MnmE/TrmE